jgi:hypothetical protein
VNGVAGAGRVTPAENIAVASETWVIYRRLQRQVIWSGGKNLLVCCCIVAGDSCLWSHLLTGVHCVTGSEACARRHEEIRQILSGTDFFPRNVLVTWK